MLEVPDYQPEHDRYPRPPKAIERCVEADTLRDVLDHWDGRGTRSPAQLTDDLDDLDHRIDTTDDRLTNRIDAIQTKQYRHLRHHALADRRRAHFTTRALYLSLGALAASVIILLVLALRAPHLLTTILLAAVLAVLTVALLAGASIYVLARRSRSLTDRDDHRTTTD
ncbi:hypothetical protein [Halococcus agarilyticus]|uniref:hypothetical protein n=1 Tax=Halococcus agarilyticus TaxID=1232219 RepID=UPI0006782A13|nr:hypothetical protein [Halococcus agarilyticus]